MEHMLLTVMAVDVRSAYNVGALFRTADAVGASLVLTGHTPYPKLPDDSRLPYVAEKAHRALAKTALGAEMTVPFRYYADPLKALSDYRNQGYRIYGLERSADAKDIFAAKPIFPAVLVLGAETKGLPQTLLAACDEVWELTMVGGKESLNVSVAAGIAMYQLRNSWLSQG